MAVDPIGLEGGLNPYEYAKGNPTMYIDDTGLLALNVVTGVVGGVINLGVDATFQYYENGASFKGYNYKRGAVAFGVGAVAGFAAPLVATTLPAAVLTAEIANVTQYFATNAVTGTESTNAGAFVSAALGVVGGGIAGKLVRPNLLNDTSGMFIPKSIATRVNTERTIRGAVLNPESLVRGSFGNGVANVNINSFNQNQEFRANQNLLNGNFYGNQQFNIPRQPYVTTYFDGCITGC